MKNLYSNLVDGYFGHLTEKIPGDNPFFLGKYHFLPPGGGAPGISGPHEFWKSKGEKSRIFGTLRGGGGQKNFIDPIKKN